MPTVTLNRKVFEDLVGKKLPEEELKERISYLGTDLESVDKDEIHVEIFPNRPDLLSEQGFARAFSSFIGVKTGLREYKVARSKEKVIIDSSVKTVRPFTACAIIKNLDFTDEKIREVIQIQEKLHVGMGRNRKKVAIGIYPFEKIKTPIRYLAKKPEDIKFLPLEGKKEMTGHQILSQHPTGREYGHLLEGKELFPLFVDADDQVLSMPPIINSETVGRVTEKTKDVFVECSGFDFHVLSTCLNIVVTALADMGGEIQSMELNYDTGKKITPNLKPASMKVDQGYINKILGLELNEKEIKECLLKMGFGYKDGNAYVPAYRSDVIHQSDLVEDVAIAYGFENFEEEIPKVATVGQADVFEKFKTRIAKILAGLGLLEVNTYHISSETVQIVKVNTPETEKNAIVFLANALNEEFCLLRHTLFPCHLDVLSKNRHNEFPQNIFEMGGVFSKDKNGKTETGIHEEDHLSVMLCGADVDYTKIRQVLDYLASMIDVKLAVSAVEHHAFISGRVGKIMLSGKDIGIIGEINPEVLENFEIDMPVVGMEINLRDLF